MMMQTMHLDAFRKQRTIFLQPSRLRFLYCNVTSSQSFFKKRCIEMFIILNAFYVPKCNSRKCDMGDTRKRYFIRDVDYFKCNFNYSYSCIMFLEDGLNILFRNFCLNTLGKYMIYSSLLIPRSSFYGLIRITNSAILPLVWHGLTHSSQPSLFYIKLCRYIKLSVRQY